MLEALTKIRAGIVDVIATLPAVLVGLVVFLAFMRISRFARNQFVNLMKRTGRSESLTTLLARLVRGTVIGIGALVAMTIALPSFQPSELIQLLGVGGIAVGFAFRDIFENFLAGILILLDQPFRIGDQIIAGDYEGTVEDIQIRATYLRTYDGRAVVIPNSDVFTNSVIVNTAYTNRRSQYDVGIGYDSDIARAQEIMLNVMQSTSGVLSDPAPDTVMMEMGDSAIVIRVRWWTQPRIKNVLQTQNLVLRGIKNRLKEEGFNIPFPIRTVMFYDQAKDGISGENVDQQRVNAWIRNHSGNGAS